MTQAFLHHLGSFVARASQTHADDQQMQARLQQLADDLSPKQNLGCGSLYVLGLIYTCSKFAGLRCPLWIPTVFLNCFAPLPN